MSAPASLTALALAASGGHHTGHAGSIIFGVALILIGGLHAVRPGLTWKMSRWQYRNRGALQPSNAGLLVIRAGGMIAAVAGIVVLIIAIAK